MIRAHAFVDTETTGLNPFVHNAYEVAWAIGDSKIHQAELPHTLENADPAALDVGHYFERGFRPWSGPSAAVHALRSELRGAILVGANPGFDSVFLLKALGVQTWFHRLIDIEQMAQWIFAWDEPKGLRAITEWLRKLGHDIPEPDHTATGDVHTTRVIFHALRSHA